jgi:hypothetical protein
MKIQRSDVLRLIGLGVLVVLEGFTVLSALLHIAFLPLGNVYPNVVSVGVLVLPALIGLVSQRLEAAVLLAELPFFVLAVIYSAVYAPIWNVDLFQLGVLVGRVASVAVILGVLSALGWLLRRILVGNTISASQAR